MKKKVLIITASYYLDITKSLKKEYDRQLLKQLVFLRISMAGGNRDAYKKVQGRDDFDLVIDNLTRIGKLKKKIKSKTTLGVAF